MATSTFYWIHTLLGPQLASLALQLHGLALTLLALAWAWPVIRGMFRKLSHSEPDVEWVQLWRCPECNTYNRRATVTCTHCQYHIKVGGMARWVPLSVSEFAKHNTLRLVRLYRLLGWLLFYGLTILAVWKLELYHFKHQPLREFFASIVLILLLLALMLFRQAFRPQLKSPLRALFDAVAGGLVTIAMLTGLYLWAEAAGEKLLSKQLQSMYSASVGRWRFLGNKPFAFEVPTLPPAPVKKAAPPKKAARPKS